MQPLLIMKTGESFPDTIARFGDMEDMVARGLEYPLGNLKVVDAVAGSLPEPGNFSGVIVTGAHSMVTEKDFWNKKLSTWIVRAVHLQIPMLGICYGHQLLAHAMGGEVGFHPRGREVGTVSISNTSRDDILLGDMPAVFWAHVTHSQSVLKLPPGAVNLARNDFEPCHAFRIGRAWGVQFHPEFSAGIVHTYIDHQEDELKEQGDDIALLRQEVKETPEANLLLKRFGKLVMEKALSV